MRIEKYLGKVIPSSITFEQEALKFAALLWAGIEDGISNSRID